MRSHYSRATSNKEFLTAELQSQKAMHELYLQWMTENHPDQKSASYRQYCDVFSFEFNIRFFISKKDRCDDCVKFENSTEEDREQMQEDYEDHVRNKDLALALYNADRIVSRQKTSSDLVLVAFDYEKSLICPKSNASVFYYIRKLTVSNLTIVDEGRHEDTCYVYDESVAGKGPNEVGSFLVHFITRKVGEGAKEFRLYSDNCFPQNKNRGVTAALLHAAAKFNITIRHRFLEKGHIYNAADNVHSLIERKSKPLDIYTPQQWHEVISNRKRSVNNPIKVVKVDNTMIFDWKDLALKLNLNEDVDGKPIPWQKIRDLSYDGNSPFELQFKLHLDDITSTKVNTRTVGRPVNIKNFVPNGAYENPRPIPQKKFKDLIYYCDHNFIPNEQPDFYRKLVQSDKAGSEGEEDEAVPKPGRARKVKPRAQSRGKKRSKGTPENLPEEDEDNESDPDDIVTSPESRPTSRPRRLKRNGTPANASKRKRT